MISCRTLCALFVSALLSPIFLTAQVRHITVDEAPSYLFAEPTLGHIHVLTAGTDLNFNGILEPDSGDVAPRWFIIDAVEERVIDSATFRTFFDSYPQRFGLDQDGGRLYVPMDGRIQAYSIESLEQVDDTVSPGFWSSVDYYAESHDLLLGRRAPDYTSPGFMTMFDLVFNDEQYGYTVGANPNMSVFGEGDTKVDFATYYTITEGVFGQPSAAVSYGRYHGDYFNAVNGSPLGGDAVQILQRNGLVYALFQKPGELRVIDPLTTKDVEGSPIRIISSGGPTPDDAPATMEFLDNDHMLVGTTSGSLRLVDLANSIVIDSLKLASRINDIAVTGSTAFAALAYHTEETQFVGDSVVVVIDLEEWKVVDTLQTGKAPYTVIADRRGALHVFGVVFVDFEPEAWWKVYENEGEGYQMTGERMLPEVDLYAVTPLYRQGSKAVPDSIYLPLDTLFAFDASDINAEPRVVLAPEDNMDRILGVSERDGYLMVEHGVSQTRPERVDIHHADNLERVAWFRRSADYRGVVPVTTEHEDATSFYILDAPGGIPSTITLFEFQPDILAPDTLGSSANHVFMRDNLAYITVNGSHNITIVDLDTWEVVRRIPTGTTGFDGPRESTLLNDGRLLVTTYAGDVRVIDPETGAIEVVETNGKTEGLTVLQGKVFAANFSAPDYSADNRVSVIDLETLSVSPTEQVAAATRLLQNVPNPAVEHTAVPFLLAEPGDVTLELYSAEGRLLATLLDQRMEAGGYQVEIQTENLPAGAYIYTLRHNGTLQTGMMQVVR